MKRVLYLEVMDFVLIVVNWDCYCSVEQASLDKGCFFVDGFF